MEYNLAMKLSLELMSTAEAAYLTTVDMDGYPETRAMLNLRNRSKYPGLVSCFNRNNQDLTTYFTTNSSSPKTRRIEANPKACVYYCSPEDWRGLMVAGNLEIVRDDDIKTEIWQDAWTMYYPGGPRDPDYAVLRLVPLFLQGYHQFQHYRIGPGESG